MARVMKGIALCSLLCTLILAALWRALRVPALLSLCITAGVIAYHFIMRLLVGALYDRLRSRTAVGIRVPLKTIAASGEMDFSQIWLAKGAGCLAGSQGFCKAKMAEIQPPDGDESF